MKKFDGTKRDFQILHTYLIETVLPPLKAKGVWMAPHPAPLSRRQVEAAFRIVQKHPNYESQIMATQHRQGATILFPHEDGSSEIRSMTQEEVARSLLIEWLQSEPESGDFGWNLRPFSETC